MLLDSPNSDARPSRLALRNELVGKLVFDDARVFHRLALNNISSQFVTKCAKAFTTDRNLLDARCELDRITAAAMGRSADELGENIVLDDCGDMRKVKRNTEEEKMYRPLRTIFRHIENFPNPSDTLKRSFESTDSTLPKSDSSSRGFPKASPDFGIFCKVKPNPQQGPKPTDREAVEPIIAQAADHARLHLSARPFQLFSVGLLIFGSRFCVAVFDRGGVVFSPIHDMWEDTEVFVRVVRSLTCRVSSVELGQGLGVGVLPDPWYVAWREQMGELGRRPAPVDFLAYVNTTGVLHGPSWHTVGLERGQLVREGGSTGPVSVLKDTWRSASRLSEPTIYESIYGDHPILADVLFPREQRHTTTSNLRGSLPEGTEGDKVVLHRLLLKPRGRPLCEYRSEKELLQGIRTALSVHESLCAQGILYRDISAGNIMLSPEASPEEGMEGFLTDLEFARLTIPAPPGYMPDGGGGMASPTIKLHAIFGPDVMHGAAMKGTLQFMAADLLGAVLGWGRGPIRHEPRHDIESFIYVLAYSVARRAALDSRDLDYGMRMSPHSFFRSAFGRMVPYDMWISRLGHAPAMFGSHFPDLVSAPVLELMENLGDWLGQAKLPLKFTPQLPISRQYVLSLLDDAIGKMDACCG